ncbi:DUF2911 domain-containing protein [Maribacter sp. ACAM166]|nr:DUF2911 domain-containing protein [Maribacter sp. ACAM166]TLP73970.1 DUF2911 domain-containing protein [Maribacter sp. ACAM166]
MEQEVGLSKITVEYSRTAVRELLLFGYQPNGKPSLVPYSTIWRLSANESTKKRLTQMFVLETKNF